MSGGPAGPVWIFGAAVAGVGIAIGATAAAAGTIVAMGSVAAYEQVKLARECSVAVKDAKNARAGAIRTYLQDSSDALCRIGAATRSEIQRLKAELERKGVRVNLSELGQTDDEILLRLMVMSAEGNRLEKVQTTRAPAEIVKSVCALIDPLFAYIPASDAAFRELTEIKTSSIDLAASTAVPVGDKTRRLLDAEQRLLLNLERYRQLSRKYEYDLAQFTTLSYANKKLAEACGETAAERRYSPENAQSQIRSLQSANAEYLKRLREKMKSDPAFAEANRQLAALVEKAVSESGCRKVSAAEKDFGFVSLFEYRSSLLRVIVSKEGMLSMDLVGRNGESKRQIKADERFFCSQGFENILRSLENNGLMMQTDSIRSLTDETILYEGDLDLWDSRPERGDATEPRHMYFDGTGGVVA